MSSVAIPDGYTAVYYFYWALPTTFAFVSTIMLAHLIFKIATVEVPSRHQKLGVATIFTMSNKLIVGAVSCLIVYFVAIGWFNRTQDASAVAFGIAFMFLGLADTCYVWFSFLRAKGILKNQSNKIVFHLFSILITYIVPVTNMSVAVCAFEPTDWPDLKKEVGLLIMALCIFGGPAVLIDLYFAWSFFWHVQDLTGCIDSQNENDGELNIVASYGLHCAMFQLNAGSLAVLGVILKTAHIEMEQPWVTVYQVCCCVKEVCFFTVIVLLVQMKLTLMRHQKDKLSALEISKKSENTKPSVTVTV